MDNCLKLSIIVGSEVLKKGIYNRIGAHTKNYAMFQNKLAQTIKSYIMSITGSQELSKEVLHKQINFICQDLDQEGTIYSGKNYSINFMRHMFKRGVRF